MNAMSDAILSSGFMTRTVHDARQRDGRPVGPVSGSCIQVGYMT